MIEIIKYNEELAGAWDDFVTKDSRNGGIFQERRFLSYHPEGTFLDASVIYYLNKKIVGVLPVALVVDENDKTTAVSHPGSSAGGLIFHKKMMLKDILSMIELTIEHYRKMGCNGLELRLAEPIFSSPTDAELPYILWHRGFELRSREISSCVDLEGESWRKLARKRKLQYMRSARSKGYKVERTNDPDGIYSLIEGNLEERYDKRPTHTLEELRELKKRYPEKIDFWLVKKDGDILAGAVIFTANKNCAHDFYTHHNYDKSHMHALPLLYSDMFEYYKLQGLKWFNIGISSRGQWIKWGILEFKEQIGARGICRDTWALDGLENYQRYKSKNNEAI